MRKHVPGEIGEDHKNAVSTVGIWAGNETRDLLFA
jgi:hypothetical protein